jgi:hypothetical protein
VSERERQRERMRDIAFMPRKEKPKITVVRVSGI